MKSPFKFLESFTLTDKNFFFGRDREVRQLNSLLQRSRLVVLYGLSGTGKSSLVQCGLMNAIDGADWLPIFIRRHEDINESLQDAIGSLLSKTSTSEEDIPSKIQQLSREYFRQVLLIFDQFEELFILGSTAELEQFKSILRNILREKLSCTVVLIIREEYLARLALIEEVIPNLLNFRLRVESMNSKNVENVLQAYFQKLNINITSPEVIHNIINKVSLERFLIELPYLQVYLDQLYKEKFYQTYPDKIIGDDETLPPINFTMVDIENFGTIDKILDTFLNEQIQKIQYELLFYDHSTPQDAVMSVLSGFISEAGTKRSVRLSHNNGQLIVDQTQQDFFPILSQASLAFCLRSLEQARILRSEYSSMEIVHDSLAKVIDNKQSAEQRELNNIKRQIRLAADMFSKTGEYLTAKQLARFEDVLPQLSKYELDFFYASHEFRKKEVTELEKERKRNYELEKTGAYISYEQKKAHILARIWMIFALIASIIAIGIGIWAHGK